MAVDLRLDLNFFETQYVLSVRICLLGLLLYLLEDQGDGAGVLSHNFLVCLKLRLGRIGTDYLVRHQLEVQLR